MKHSFVCMSTTITVCDVERRDAVRGFVAERLTTLCSSHVTMTSHNEHVGDVMSFFNLSQPLVRKVVQGGQTQGYVVPSEELLRDPHSNLRSQRVRPNNGQDYITQIRLNESVQMAESWRLMSLDEETTMAAGNAGWDIADIEHVTLTSTGTMPDLSELTAPSTAVYQQYDFNHTPDKTLPIFSERERILDTIESNMVTVIQGPTGCGKSTQVPQYILDSCASRGAPCNIIITQPRRIAAITVARRVSNERDWPLPSVVGYHVSKKTPLSLCSQVGLNNQTSEDTRLTFCTTGVLVQKMINKKTLEGYTHIILDEVHERDMDMDFAILIVRKLCFTTSRHIKVILMSATFNVTKFADYFTVSDVQRKVHMPVPVIDLDKSKSKNRIINYYLDQLGVLGPLPDIETKDPRIKPESYSVAVKLIQEFDQLERQTRAKKGAVLVFLPGIREIEELFNMLTEKERASELKWWIRPLHSSITVEEQESVFKPPPKDCRKIILSTNIAESSITVPDIVYGNELGVHSFDILP
uniref:RNA helicase n=1 Tax=Timema monikensis TaxID=170555 RepID=A0A7R9EBU5_9NEOP|nr:unnamed protein product [Timema monikensis]